MTAVDGWVWMDWFLVGLLLGVVAVVAWRRFSVVMWSRARPWSFFAGVLVGGILMSALAGAYDDGWSVLSDPSSPSNIREKLDREQQEWRLNRLEAERSVPNPC